MEMKHQPFGLIRSTAAACIRTGILVIALTLMGGPTYGEGPSSGSAGATGTSVSAPESEKNQKAELAEIAAKPANPVSDIWALFTEFDICFNDGDMNRGAAKVGSSGRSS
jgi:hypothetical protein